MNAKHALAHIRQQDWQPLKAFVGSATPETAYELIKLCSGLCPLDTPLEAVISDEPDLTGLILSGGLRLGLSRRHRGMDTADRLSESQIENCYYQLNIAQERLSEALRRDRHNGLAAAFYMATHIDPVDKDGQQLAEARLLEARNVPLSGYMNLLSARLSQRDTTPDDLFAVVRSHLSAAEPCRYALLARAHYEFPNQPDALTELMTASDILLRAGDADPAELRLAQGWLALALSRAGLNRRAARHLKALNGFEDRSIWQHSRLPVKLKKSLIHVGALVR